VPVNLTSQYLVVTIEITSQTVAIVDERIVQVVIMQQISRD